MTISHSAYDDNVYNAIIRYFQINLEHILVEMFYRHWT